MKNALIAILIIITTLAKAQVIIQLSDTNVVKGQLVYQIGISLSDTTIKTLHWVILSGSCPDCGNAGLAFCFGKPRDFETGIKNTTGQIYVYNPVIILERGPDYIWTILTCAYNPFTNAIVYRGIEELMFPKLPMPEQAKQTFIQKSF